MQNGVVLDGGGDEVLAGGYGAEEREVVALGAAGGKDDLRRVGVQQAGDGVAGAVDGGARALALLMDGAGIAKLFEKVGAHGVKHFRQQRRGGVRIHVDAIGNRAWNRRHGYKFTPIHGLDLLGWLRS